MDLLKWIRHQWDRAMAVVATVIGCVALLLGWLGISRSSLPGEQIPYLASGAVVGLMAVGVGATLWLSADLRDLWRKFDEIDEHLQSPDGFESDGGTVPVTRESGSRQHQFH
jgi:hypothetical protein